MEIYSSIKKNENKSNLFIIAYFALISFSVVFLFFENYVDIYLFTIIFVANFIFIYIIKKLLEILIIGDYIGKTLKISKVIDKDGKDNNLISRYIEATGKKKEKKLFKYGYANAIESFFSTQLINTKHNYTIIKIYKNKTAFIEHALTKRKYLIDLRTVDVTIVN
jgi:hypothetical protein